MQSIRSARLLLSLSFQLKLSNQLEEMCQLLALKHEEFKGQNKMRKKLVHVKQLKDMLKIQVNRNLIQVLLLITKPTILRLKKLETIKTSHKILLKMNQCQLYSVKNKPKINHQML